MSVSIPYDVGTEVKGSGSMPGPTHRSRRYAVTGAVPGGLILLTTVVAHRRLTGEGLGVYLGVAHLHGRRRTSALTYYGCRPVGELRAEPLTRGAPTY